MMDLPFSDVDFLAYVYPEEVVSQDGDPIALAVYAPGLPCADYRRHQDAPCSLTHAFLAPIDRDWGWLGPDCVQWRNRAAHSQPWQTALNQRHPFAGVDVPPDWRATTRREYWTLAPLLGLLIAVEPRPHTAQLLRGYLERVTQGKRPFTAGEWSTLQAILRERGTPDPPSDWAEELQAHRAALLRRRNLAFRLARLAALPLAERDRATVVSLAADNVKWYGKRMGTLTERQVALVESLEARYLAVRLDYAAQLAGTWRLRLEGVL